MMKVHLIHGLLGMQRLYRNDDSRRLAPEGPREALTSPLH